MAPPYRNPLGALALAWLLAPLAAAQFKNDFSLYDPDAAQGCLNDAADRSQCTGSNSQEMNTCLCADSGKFLTNTAVCLGREAPVTLVTVWNGLNTACTDSGLTIAIPSGTFISMGQAEMGTPSTRTTAVSSGGSSSTAASTLTTLPASRTTAETSATGTASPPPQEPSGTGVNDDELPPPSDMSIAVMAGIGVAGAVVAGLIGGVAFIIWKRRRANKLNPQNPFYHLPDGSNNDSRNPTLREWKPTDPYSPHGPPPPPPSSGGLSVPGQMTGLGVSSAVSPVTATATSPYPPSTAWTPNSPQAGWGGSYHSPTWTGSPVFAQGSAPGAFAELPSDRQAAHELDSIEVPRPPVEMPTSYNGPSQSGPVWADIKPTKS